MAIGNVDLSINRSGDNGGGNLLGMIKYVVLAVVFLLVVIFFRSFFTIVGPGDRGVLMNFGAVSSKILEPGFHFKLPIKQTVEMLSVQVQKKQSQESAASKDLQIVTTTVAVNYHLDPGKVNAIYRDIGTLSSVENKIIDPAVANAVKAVTARYNADELISNRGKVRAEIEAQVKDSTRPYNVIVNGLNITNFSFSKEYDRAIEDKQVAQQRALKAQYQLQQAQIDSQKQVVEAKAAAKARIERAKGQAQATILAAQAEAKAMTLKNKAVTPAILQLNAIAQWNGKLPGVMAGGQGGAVPFINIPHSGNMASTAAKSSGGK